MKSALGKVLHATVISGLLCVPLTSSAAVCGSGSFASILATGSCSISDTTFTWGPPSLSNLVWFTGPFGGDTVLGPSADSVTFTPLVSSTNPGFMLSGPFSVTGRNFMDVNFGYFYVEAPSGFEITGRSVAMGGANVTQATPTTQDNQDNIALLNNVSASAVVNGEGFTQLSGFQDLGGSAPIVGNLVVLRAYDYSSNPLSVTGFTDASFNFPLVPITTPVPEPATVTLLGIGLAGLALRRRKRAANLTISGVTR